MNCCSVTWNAASGIMLRARRAGRERPGRGRRPAQGRSGPSRRNSRNVGNDECSTSGISAHADYTRAGPCRRSNPAALRGIEPAIETDPATRRGIIIASLPSHSRACLSPSSTPSFASGLQPHWAPRPPRSTAAGNPLRADGTRSSPRRPARARPSRRSCRRSTICSRRASGGPARRGPRALRLAAQGAERGHPQEPGRAPTRYPTRSPRPLAFPRQQSPPRCAPATRRRRNGRRWSERRRTFSSRHPSRCICC